MLARQEENMCRVLPLLVLVFSLTAFPWGASATDYHVGPGFPLEAIGDVPWESLGPGDNVYIHWREEAYHEKWVIGTSGTEQSPILVRGVPGSQGQLPVIDGRDATTRLALSYWNENRGLLKIGGTSVPADSLPSHIIIENLDLRSARPPYTFTDDQGNAAAYSLNAASFYVEKGRHITIRNCIIHDSGNGIFIGVNDGQTRDILIEGNSIHDNGNEGRIYEHNTYTAAIGIVYQFNHMGGLRPGALGNNLKDRSAGLVVRYNWIENGNRQLDLVDGEDSEAVVNDPAYHTTHVYGNVLKEADNEGNSQIVHYGGDSGTLADYRKGTLFFYNNTVISTRTGNTTLFRLSTNEESAQVFNNILYTTAGGSYLALLDATGQLSFKSNWLRQDWRISHGSFSGTFSDAGNNIEGDEPGFVDFAQQDYHLTDSSQARNQGTELPAELAAGHPLLFHYVRHQQSEARPDDKILDIGALEASGTVMGDINGNGAVDLGDAILALQVLSASPAQIVFSQSADVGSDSRVTMEEALYVLDILSTQSQ